MKHRSTPRPPVACAPRVAVRLVLIGVALLGVAFAPGCASYGAGAPSALGDAEYAQNTVPKGAAIAGVTFNSGLPGPMPASRAPGAESPADDSADASGATMGGYAHDEAQPRLRRETLRDGAASHKGPGRSGANGAGPRSKPHVRREFPETLLVAPRVITDENGRAELPIPRMADSITTWRVRAVGHTADGVFGQGSGTFRVFQDLFLNLQVPRFLSVGDHLMVPLSVFNHTDTEQQLTLTVTPAAWFTADTPGASYPLRLKSKTAGKAWFGFTVTQPGNHVLKVTARAAGTDKSDAVEVPVEAAPLGVPRGRAVPIVVNGEASFTLDFPGITRPESREILIVFETTPRAALRRAVEALLRAPTGCLEQTLSVTSLDILAADAIAARPGDALAKRRATLRARATLRLAYQRLLSFRRDDGRFGSYPGVLLERDAWLDAYVLEVLKGLARHVAVDSALVEALEARFVEALGSFQDGPRFFRALWAYAEGREGPLPAPVALAAEALAKSATSGRSLYAQAVLLNAFAALGNETGFQVLLDHMLGRLEFGAPAGASSARASLRLPADAVTLAGTRGPGASVETEALLLLALATKGQVESDGVIGPLVTRLVTALYAARGPNGLWGNTQATALAVRALARLDQARGRAAADAPIVVQGSINGTAIERLELGAGDGRIVAWTRAFAATQADNRVELTTSGPVRAQLVQRAVFPDAESYATPAFELLIEPSTRTCRQGEPVTLAVTLRRRGFGRLPPSPIMAWWPGALGSPPLLPDTPTLVRVGIPPTFRVLTDALDVARDAGLIAKYERSARHLVLYLTRGVLESFEIPLIAVNPGTVHSAFSEAYEYYAPEAAGMSPPQAFEVHPR